MDVDICHFSDDPLTYGGQWEHAKGIASAATWLAVMSGWQAFWIIIILRRGRSISGSNRYWKQCFTLIGFAAVSEYGALHARETGWALRTLVDLYNETNDESWLEKCDWIVGHFEQWEKKYGYFLAPYTDNTEIRVVFMIAVAINSLMRYYHVRPDEKIKGMIIRATDDLMENCRLDSGLFYYKELPSLQKPSNPNILESLTIAYGLTGDIKYLQAGIPTFKLFLESVAPLPLISKRIENDALIHEGEGTKKFAQSFRPVVTFYNAASKINYFKYNLKMHIFDEYSNRW